MSKEFEVLQDALELLAVATFITPKLQAKRTDVINAGLKVLAEQPAPKVVDCHTTGICVQSGLRAEQPAQQEPVAQWQCRHIFRTDNLWENCTEDDAKSLQKATPTFEIRKLYTTPPKRKLVDLTTEDKDAVVAKADVRVGADHNLSWCEALISETAAKLEEKNT